MASNLTAIAPQFLVEDVVRAAEYYRDKLGFAIGPYFEDPPVFVIVRRDDARIMLGLAEHGRGGSNRKWREAGIDAYLWVNDVDSLYAQFTANGVEVSGPPCLQFYGIREIEVRDLDGYILTFGQPA
jgi:uncharacterized glyoxalase superfamily protein PhnB